MDALCSSKQYIMSSTLLRFSNSPSPLHTGVVYIPLVGRRMNRTPLVVVVYSFPVVVVVVVVAVVVVRDSDRNQQRLTA